MVDKVIVTINCHILFQFGGEKFDEVEKTRVLCRVLDGVDCAGNSSFFRENVPCLK